LLKWSKLRPQKRKRRQRKRATRNKLKQQAALRAAFFYMNNPR
jgi:hypothetical protein